MNNKENPFNIEPGVDFNVRNAMYDLFERKRNDPNFDHNDWETWDGTGVEAHKVVYALVKDLIDTGGAGFDILSAAYYSDFLMASMFNEIAFRNNVVPLPEMYINIYDPFFQEGVAVKFNRPDDFEGVEMDPIPGFENVVKLNALKKTSNRSNASLLVRPTGDAMNVHPMTIVAGLKQVSDFFVTKGQLPFIYVAGVIVIWKAMQLSHCAKTGVIYREIVNPTIPDMPPSDMRMIAARSGKHIDTAVVDRPDEVHLMLG